MDNKLVSNSSLSRTVSILPCGIPCVCVYKYEHFSSILSLEADHWAKEHAQSSNSLLSHPSIVFIKLHFFFFKDFTYLFFKERVREGEKECEKHQLAPHHVPQFNKELNLLPLALQDQPPEPHQSGYQFTFLLTVCGCPFPCIVISTG